MLTPVHPENDFAQIIFVGLISLYSCNCNIFSIGDLKKTKKLYFQIIPMIVLYL